MTNTLNFPYTPIRTEDGSITFFNTNYGEHYHSLSGAFGEAKYLFIESTELLKRGTQNSISILDVGFGLGINFFTALKECNDKKFVSIVSLESDLYRLSKDQFPVELNDYFEIYNELLDLKSIKNSHFDLALILGDAIETIRNIHKKFDVVFLDAFSPLKNPKLWSLDFFKELRKRINPNGVLATFSAASSVQSNLIESGFTLRKIPGFGKKRYSLLGLVPGTFSRFGAGFKKI